MTAQYLKSKSSVEETGYAYDRLSSLFQVDTMAAQQYQDTFRRKIPQQAEIRLMLSVLEDAINCYQDNLFAINKKRLQLFKEAEEWFCSDDTSWIFSFVSICSILNLEPGYCRQGLNRWASERRIAPRTKTRNMPAQNRLVA